MLVTILRSVAVIVFVPAFGIVASAQESKPSPTERVLIKTGNATAAVAGQSAKLTYKAAKFTAGKIAKPIIVNSAPAVGKFILKQTGRTIKVSVPVGKKLFIKYIKYKVFL